MADDATRLPPHSPEAEQGVLGCILLAPDECTPRVIEALGATTEAFYDLRHKVVYESILALWEKNTPADLVSVSQHLRDRSELDRVGMGYLSGMPDLAPVPAALEHRLAVVQDKQRRRAVVAACAHAIASAHNCHNPQEFLEDIAKTLAETDKGRDEEMSTAKKFVHEYINELEQRFNLNGALPGLATGIYDFDRTDGGLRLKQMLVIGARPYEGKTALACNLIERVCIMENHPTLFLSLEMTRAALMDRFTALVGGISIVDLSKGTLNQGDFQKVLTSNARISKAPLFIIEATGGMSSAEVAASMRRHARQHGVKFVVVDYLQKISSVGKHDKNTYGIGDTCKRLRHAAVMSDVALVCLAQLNREIDKGKKPRGPRMSDLADSKAIEAEADTVILLDRVNNDRNLLIPKSRNAGPSSVSLLFDERTLRFKNKSKVE